MQTPAASPPPTTPAVPSPGPRPLRILLLCHSFNSLSQRLYAELLAQGHGLSVELDIADSVTQEAVALFRPDLVLAPFLKRRIPAAVWQTVPCLVVHPGPPGDQGPSALDWAVLRGESHWGVTVLQANADFDAGPVWAHAHFALRPATKGSLYRREVTDAAWAAVREAVALFAADAGPPNTVPLAPRWRPAMRQADCTIDWARDTTAAVLVRLRSADGQPGVLDQLWGLPCRLFDPHPATPDDWAGLADAPPGEVLAVRDGALLRRTVDGAVWLGQACLVNPTRAGPGSATPFKQVAEQVFADQAAHLPQRPAPLVRPAGQWGELRYTEHGPEGARVGCLGFAFANGAMSTARCQRLLAALQWAQARPTQVLLLLGGGDFFSNGIDLNAIEAAAHRPGDSAADESWRNIQAMDDVALAVLTTTDRLTVSVLRGNAGAGGVFLAICADEIWSGASVVMNPHYKNMGNLYGSEYWTYGLPRRLGEAGAQALMAQRLPLLAPQAQRLGLIDHCDTGPRQGLTQRCLARALALAASPGLAQRLTDKVATRERDEARRPLADHRAQELARMHRNFYGFDPSYHVARHHFVHKLPQAWTPRHLAIHR